MIAPNNTALDYRDKRIAFISSIPDYPENQFSGRGIVIPGGGTTYFTCAYVLIRRLRALGCTLPIELWHLGAYEVDSKMIELVKEYGVTVVDAYKLRKYHPIKNLNGWELNPYSLLWSKFEEVLFLDADNIPVKDPTFLFGLEEYKSTGALFWPDYDYQRLKQNNPIWGIMGIPYRDEQTFESGQIVVNKRVSWKPLNLAVHFNSESDFYYRFILGDKDTFRFGWHCLEQKYSIIPHPVHQLPAKPLPSLCMCQHAPDGSRIFQHRNMDKYRLDMPNFFIYDLAGQDECAGYIEDLRKLWNGKVQSPTDSAEVTTVKNELLSASWGWSIAGHHVKIAFSPEGKVLNGNQLTGDRYRVEDTGDGVTLTTLDDFRINSRLHRTAAKSFSGTRVHNGLRVELKDLK